MILVDTSPLVAFIDAGQGESHDRSVELYRNIREPLLTTWSCFTEAMYFLYQRQGWPGQKMLWSFIQREALFLHASSVTEQRRLCELMEQYQDVPMDLADASLVAAAEILGMRRIFTLDSDFYVYRLHGTEAFEVIR
ncbi:PIN domain-containing protein [Chroococcidiopsis sp. CCMEE 29]|uniref:type II toxin-antitoxin system VapC family toxin n=1 Tax=Chroococcidiopsis sp. CCMEE 29 TaxID=155894 RepID=UPI002021519C|nr:PIN domain-containing protein [Chroococcidiopsis sp. CCMEE 29]